MVRVRVGIRVRVRILSLTLILTLTLTRTVVTRALTLVLFNRHSAIGLSAHAPLQPYLHLTLTLTLTQHRGLVFTGHPNWNYVISPGFAWDQEGDQGYSRASVPFALLQRNSQCVHNGVLMFLFRSDGSTSDVRFQITQESCLYFKVDMWGQLRFEKSTAALTSETDRSILTARFDLEILNRFPTKSLMNDLPRDFPGVDPTVDECLSCLVVSCLVLVFSVSCLVLSCLCLVSSCLVLSCLVSSCLVVVLPCLCQCQSCLTTRFLPICFVGPAHFDDISYPHTLTRKVFGSAVPDQHLNTYGVIVDGVQYTTRCRTRYGEYPHCFYMVQPSYSTAKSAFAGLAMMAAAQKYGAHVFDLKVIDLLPLEWDRYGEGNWSQVTLSHTLEMATG
jgi:hypothetical protein